jgi:hypothetical protein
MKEQDVVIGEQYRSNEKTVTVYAKHEDIGDYFYIKYQTTGRIDTTCSALLTPMTPISWISK